MANALGRTSAGTRIYVSYPPTQITNGSSYLVSDFTALTWSEVGETIEIGNFGKKYNGVKYIRLGDRRTIKRRGSYDNGTLNVKMASAPTDAGQVILEAASNSDLSYCFKVVTQSGSTYYFTAQTMGWQLEIGSVDQIMGATADLEIDNDILSANLTA